jgi:uncharacterized protein (TIGR02598 family)
MLYKKAFSLVEVVVAVGIFALAIVGVIGLLSPTNKAVADVADGDSASRAISAIQSGLQAVGFDQVSQALLDPSAAPEYRFFASRSGDKVGLDGDVPNTEKFFEFALIRNTTLSPSLASDSTSGYLAFTISLRWPAYLPNGVQFTADAQKSVLIVPAAITR